MKFDQKTGKKIPENRMDEILLSNEKTNKMAEDAKGMLDPNLVKLYTLQDINISLALLVDMVGTIINRQIKAEKTAKDNPSEKEQ